MKKPTCILRSVSYAVVLTGLLALAGCGPSPGDAAQVPPGGVATPDDDTRTYRSDSSITIFSASHEPDDSVAEGSLQFRLIVEASEGPAIHEGEYFTADLVVKTGGNWELKDQTLSSLNYSACGKTFAIPSGDVSKDTTATSVTYHVKLVSQDPGCNDSQLVLAGGLIVVVMESLPDMVDAIHFEHVLAWSNGVSHPIRKQQ